MNQIFHHIKMKMTQLLLVLRFEVPYVCLKDIIVFQELQHPSIFNLKIVCVRIGIYIFSILNRHFHDILSGGCKRYSVNYYSLLLFCIHTSLCDHFTVQLQFVGVLAICTII